MPIDPAAFARLPSIPAVAVKLLQHFSNTELSLGEVADILRPDPALTARLLRAASSAEFGVGKPLTDARRAVQMLGTRRVTSLALSFLLSDDSTKPGPAGTLYRETWVRCVVQAITMEQLAAKRVRGSEPEHYTCGLLLEIGALALLKGQPTEFLKVADAAWSEPERREQIELELLGCTQADVSVALFRHWRLPTQLTDAVRRRYESVVLLSQSTSAAHRALIEGAAMATAVGDYFCTGETGTALVRCMELGQMFFRMEISDIRVLLGDVHCRMRAAAALFNTDVSRLESPEALMEKAQTQLKALLPPLDSPGEAAEHPAAGERSPGFHEAASRVLAVCTA